MKYYGFFFLTVGVVFGAWHELALMAQSSSELSGTQRLRLLGYVVVLLFIAWGLTRFENHQKK